MTTQQSKLRVVAEFLFVGVCTLAFAFTVVGMTGGSLLGKDAAGTRDFVEYWASGQQLAHRANPYDADAILRLERSAGFPLTAALVMWNPPSALLLVLPLGFLGPKIGWLLWSMLLLSALVASVRMVWIMHGRPKSHLNVLGYSFGPALVCLFSGQVSIFVLLGLVIFLRWNRSRPLLAGASLWFCLLKPHLFLPFGVVLLAWVVITQSYKLLAGASVALGFSTAIAFLFDPQIWMHYSKMVSAAQMEATIPCLSIMLRQHVSPGRIWLQYLPAVLGCAWALAYFRKHREDWDWMEHGSLLMLVSVLVAPYTWLMDQAILIPALLHAAYLTRSRNLLAVLALASAALEIGIFGGVPLLHSALYLWTAPAWLAWYLSATRGSNRTYALEPRTHPSGALMELAKD